MHVAAIPGSVGFATQERCNNSISITWNALLNDPCPIIGYNIDVNTTTISKTAGVTSFNYPLGNDSCGKTYQISVYAINAAGIGSKTFSSQFITCTRKRTTISVYIVIYEFNNDTEIFT